MNFDLMPNGNLTKNIEAAADLLRSDHCQAAHVYRGENGMNTDRIQISVVRSQIFG